MTGERLGPDHSQASHDGHESRYRLAAGWCRPGDFVLDVACGTGYGSFLLDAHGDVAYTGVDRCPDAVTSGLFIQADLDEWVPDYRNAYDVGVCFETLEHLRQPERLADILTKYVTRTLLVSVPVVPTVGVNEWHLHDFTVGDVDAMFTRRGWRTVQRFDQPAEVSSVWVFER